MKLIALLMGVWMVTVAIVVYRQVDTYGQGYNNGLKLASQLSIACDHNDLGYCASLIQQVDKTHEYKVMGINSGNNSYYWVEER